MKPVRLFILVPYLVAACVGVFLLHGIALNVRPQSSGSNATHAQREVHANGVDRVGKLKSVLTPFTYMDEEFHIPQAAAYFALGNFTAWDPMITTPFGAY